MALASTQKGRARSLVYRVGQGKRDLEANTGPTLAAAMTTKKRLPAPVTPAAPTPARAPTTAAAPTIQQQAMTLAQALYQPIVDQFTQAANQRAAAGTDAIKGASSSLADAFASHDYTAPYTPGITDQAGIDAALHAALTGAGGTAAAALADRLKAGGVDQAAIDAAAGTATSAGTGSANTALGLGSAELGRLNADKTAAAAYGAKLPGIARLAGLQDITSLQNSVTGDLTDKLAALAGQQPQLVYGIIGDLQKQADNQTAASAEARKPDATLSAAAGHLVNQYGETIPGADGKPVPYTPYSKPTAGSVKVIKGPDGYYTIDAAGHASKLGVGLPPTSSGKTSLQSKTINGHVATFDPTTGTYYIPGTSTPVDPNSFRKPVKVSQTSLKNARAAVQQVSKGFYASQVDPSKPLSSGAISSAAKAAGMTVGEFLADTDQGASARAAAGIGFNQVAQHDDGEIQQLYLTLVKQYGIPARQAFQMVAGTYRQWGQAHKDAYFPKAEAAQDAAASPAAYVTVAPTANRQGVALNPAVTEFVGRIGELARQRLTIGTGTNHNQYVIGTTRQSAHWTGNAADIPATGEELTRLGQDALIAAGADPTWARKQKGGLYNIGGYQVIFNSMEGGDHFNHLHVGLRSLT